jgi:hypothetical protein
MTAKLHTDPPPSGAHRTSPFIAIAHGTLPTASALFAPCRAAGVTADSALRVLRSLMMKERLADALRLLNSLGFTWQPVPSLPDADMQEAIDAVAASLDGEVTR